MKQELYTVFGHRSPASSRMREFAHLPFHIHTLDVRHFELVVADGDVNGLHLAQLEVDRAETLQRFSASRR